MKKSTTIFFAAAICCAVFCQCKGQEEINDLGSRIGVCRYPVDPEEGQDVADAGYASQELAIDKYLAPDMPDEEWQAVYDMLVSYPVKFASGNGFFPRSYKLVGPDADVERNLTYAEAAVKRANKLGIKLLVLGSGGARSIPEGFPREEAEKQFLQLCEGIGEIGEKFDVTVVIEPLNKNACNYINTVREASAIARKVDKEYLKVLADFFHMAQENEGPDAIIEAGDLLRHCHIAESDGSAPGVNGEDFSPYLEALKAIGYKGNIVLECDWDKEASRSEQLKKAFDETKRQIDTIFK